MKSEVDVRGPRSAYQLLYAVPSLDMPSAPLCTSLMPGSCWSTDITESSCSTVQLLLLPVIGSFGICLMYWACTRSSSDWGAFCLSSVYCEMRERSWNKSCFSTDSLARRMDWL